MAKGYSYCPGARAAPHCGGEHQHERADVGVRGEGDRAVQQPPTALRIVPRACCVATIRRGVTGRSGASARLSAWHWHSSSTIVERTSDACFAKGVSYFFHFTNETPSLSCRYFCYLLTPFYESGLGQLPFFDETLTDTGKFCKRAD